MEKNIPRLKIFVKTISEAKTGFFILLLFILILELIIIIINYLFPQFLINLQLFLNIIEWVIVIVFGLYIYKITKWDEDQREYQKQISLLESLYYELDAISSNKRKIELIKTTITTGNLQWVKDLFGVDLMPAHGIWNLNTPIYIENLSNIINKRETKQLKTALIHIKQKTELIGNYLTQFNNLPNTTKEHKLHRESVKKAIIKVIDETITFVDDCKNFIKENFDVKITE